MAHGRSVRNLSKDDALYEAVIRDYTQADLSPADRAMLDYVAKLVQTPENMEPVDVEVLRENGFSDSGICDIAMNVSVFFVMNRMVDGLGAYVGPQAIEEAERLGLTIPDHLRHQPEDQESSDE